MIQSLMKFIKKLRKKSYPAFRSSWQDERQMEPQSQPTLYRWTTFNEGMNSTSVAAVTTNYSVEAMTTPERDVSPLPKSERIEKKPVELVGDIRAEKPVLLLGDLDKQIKIIKNRIRILEEQDIDPKDEIEALGYLKARKFYSRVESLFRWEITNQQLIDDLCNKFKVRMVNFESYHKVVPNEALDQLEQYLAACRKVSRKIVPVLKLIIDDGGKETRRDPILLATSPFGRWYYILGAWDKEVAIVEDLIYRGK